MKSKIGIATFNGKMRERGYRREVLILIIINYLRCDSYSSVQTWCGVHMVGSSY